MFSRVLRFTLLLTLAIVASAGRPQAADAASCTIYASPSGSGSSSGTSSSSPTSLSGAHDRSVAGSVICLLPGTYERTSSLFVRRSGTTANSIVYRSSTGVSGDVLLLWTGGRPSTGESGGILSIPPGAGVHHVEFTALTLDGQNDASSGFFCGRGAHHITYRRAVIRNTGSSGIATKGCDYVVADGNQVHHTGYDPNRGWSSAISINDPTPYDSYRGFHNVAVNNVISGATDDAEMTDGNGVIVDRGGAGIPGTLVANNVIYNNGGRCVHVVDSAHVWAVNNTCYKDGLDRRQSQPGEFSGILSASTDLHFINNVGYAWTGRPPFRLAAGASAVFSANIEYGGTTSDVPASVRSTPSQLRRVDPLFSAPPAISATGDQQQRIALPPWSLGTRLMPRSGSPLIDRGIDPRTAPGITPELRAGMNAYLLRDVRGAARGQGAGWDIGAYEGTG